MDRVTTLISKWKARGIIVSKQDEKRLLDFESSLDSQRISRGRDDVPVLAKDIRSYEKRVFYGVPYDKVGNHIVCNFSVIV